MSQESAAYPLILQAIIDNMQLQNREQLIQTLQQSMQPDPAAQEAAQAAQQVQLEFQQSQTNALNGQAVESQARAEKISTETKAIPVELENERLKAIATTMKAEGDVDKDFERRVKVAETLISEKKLGIEEAKLTLRN